MRRIVFAVIGVVFLAGSSALAHHSYAGFVQDQVVSIEGDVEAFHFVNPHVILKVRTQDARVYTAALRSSTQLGRDGMTSTSLKVGDRVVISGSPSRDAAELVLTLIREVRRPADGWHWTR